MDAGWDTFFVKAQNADLKYVLNQLNLATSGNKSTLKLRIEEAVKEFSDAQRQELIPEEWLRTHGSSGSAHNSECGGDEIEDNTDGEDLEEVLNNELVRLRNIVAKKKEIFKLKEQLRELELEDTPVNSRSTDYTFRDLEDAVPKFTGDDKLSIDRWIELYEESAEIMSFDIKTKFIYGKRLLSGTARLFIRTIPLKTWKDLKNALRCEFGKHVTKADIHNELRNRLKRKDESIQQYVLAMQEIASAGCVDEEDLIQYVIKGIQDTESNKMLLYQANNMSELKSAIRKYEKLKANSYDNPINKSKKNTSFEKKPVSKIQLKVRCFNCKEIGHFSKYCTKPRTKPTVKTSSSSVNVMSLQQSSSSSDVNGTDDKIQKPSQLSLNRHISTNIFERTLDYTFYKGNAASSSSLLSLLDSGSPISFVQQKFLPAYVMTTTVQDKQSFYGINGSLLSIVGTVDCKILYDNAPIHLNLFVVKNESMYHCVILGRNFMEKCDLCLQKKSTVDTGNIALCEDSLIHASDSSNKTYPSDYDNDDENFEHQILNINVSSENSDISLNLNEKLPFDIKNKIESIVKQAWLPNVESSVTPRSDFQMKIRVTKEDPFFCAPRRLPYVHKIELQKILNELLSKGIIRESTSPFASPIVLVKKKNGEFRLCVDFRELNKVTIRDNYPLPLIEDHLDRLRGKRYFTTLDLKNGFHHVEIADDSIKYTSFITPLGQYEYTRMPFGLKNAPSVFERYMKRIFGKLLQDGRVLSFIDDILIATETIEEHFDVLTQVMDVVRKHNLQLRIDKCSFFQNEIVYLGYKINVDGVRPSEDHLRAVKDFPTPSCTKDIHSFLGLCSYFRKFMKDFAITAKPLYDLIKKDTPFVFGQREYRVFETLKSELVNSPVLCIYNPKSETELHCDASNVGFGAVLLQKQKDERFHPIFYFSKRATELESRYHSFELETLAIIYALRRFRVYLLGISFKIVTDCQSLSLTLNKKTLNPRISRWALEMQEFSYTLEHRKGQKMMHADALSRAINTLNATDETFEFIMAASQRRDKKIESIALDLAERENANYEMIDGLIYRKVKGKILFYVPSHMETEIIRTHHEAMGHMGVDKCYEFLARTYWFPGMKEKIKKQIGTCLKCIYFSPNSGKAEGVLHSIPKGDLPFDSVHVDHYGPLANSKTKKKYIFLVVDGFTKFVKLYAVKTTQTKEVLDCLESYFQHYSRPRRVVSDRGTCFTSKEFSDFLASNNIEHIKVASQCPQANGQVERVNRILTPMLAKLCDPDTTSDWCKYLVRIEYALNNTVSKSTGFSPSTLLFGVNQKGALCDKVLEYLGENTAVNREDLNIIRKQACEKMDKCAKYNKTYYDKSHKQPTTYKEGDYVMLKNITNVPGVNKKLFAKYRGPYKVEKILPNDRYLVKDIDGLQLTRKPFKTVCAPCNMKPFMCTPCNDHDEPDDA